MADDAVRDKVYPMRFTWRAEWGGDHCIVKGAFNDWGAGFEMKPAADGTGDLETIIRLKGGSYNVKYIVNDEWRLAPNQPTVTDASGNLNNVAVVDAVALERQQALINIARKASQSFTGTPEPVKPPSSTARADASSDMTHEVVQYRERGVAAKVSEGVTTDHLPDAMARIFDVIVSPSMIHSPHSPADAKSSIKQVSSYNMLVDMTVKQVTDANPAMIDLSHKIRTGFAEAFAEQTKAVLQKTKHKLKTAEEQAVCFDRTCTHPHLSLDDTQMTATKTGVGGTYRSARAKHPIMRGQTTYFEVLFDVQSKCGGICVGVAAGEPSLNQLVGTPKYSMGLYSTGDAVVEGTWSSYASPYEQGTTVGVLCRSQVNDDGSETLTCTFQQNGKPCGDRALALTLPGAMPAFPSVTLYTSRTKVTLCPVAADLKYIEAALAGVTEEVLTIGGELLDQATIDRVQNMPFHNAPQSMIPIRPSPISDPASAPQPITPNTSPPSSSKNTF